MNAGEQGFCGQARGRSLTGVPWVLSLIAIAGPLLLTGCAWKIGPEYVRPEAPLTDEWQSTSDPRIAAEPTDHGEWWKVFNDPVLDALIDEACAQNLSLQMAGLRIVQSRATRTFEAWQLAPYVGVTGSYSHVNFSQSVEPEISIIGPKGPTAPVAIQFDGSTDIYQAGFDSFWEPDVWGEKRRGIESESAAYEATVAQYDDVLVSLIGEVAAAYVQVRTSEQRLDRILENIDLQAKILEVAQKLLGDGRGPQVDAELLKVLLRDTQARVPALKKARFQAVAALCVLLGSPPQDIEDRLGVAGSIPTAPAQVAVGVPADLLRRRPDVRMAERAAAAQSARIGATKAIAVAPTVSIAGALGYSTSDTSRSIRSDSLMGFYGIGLRWNILAYPALVNAIRFEDARFQEAALQYQETVLRAVQEVENAANAFAMAQDQARLLSESAEAAKKAVELAAADYTNSGEGFAKAFDALGYLALQSDRMLATQGAMAINLIALNKALGGGWQVRDGKAVVTEEIQEQMRARSDWRTFNGEAQLATVLGPPVPVDQPER